MIDFSPRSLRACFLSLVIATAFASPISGTEVSPVVINDAAMGGALDAVDQFGSGVSAIGDLDGDGNVDLAIGAFTDDDGPGSDAGALYILLMDGDGGIKPGGITKISETLANDPNDAFQIDGSDLLGRGIAPLGDYDGDGNFELAVGASQGGSPSNSGVVWILDLNSAGVPQSGFALGSGLVVSDPQPDLTLDASDRFGFSLANLGDWDGDGAPELAVGAFRDDDGGASQSADHGAVYLLYLDPAVQTVDCNPPTTVDCPVKGYTKISDASGGGIESLLAPPSWFGTDVTAIGDLDGDGQTDLAVGARENGTYGSVFILFMDPDCATDAASCSVKSGVVEITEDQAGFDENVGSNDDFGMGLAWLDDPAGLFPERLAVGTWHFGGNDEGAVFLLTLNPDGTVAESVRFSDNVGGMVNLDPSDFLGYGLGAADLNGDGNPDIVAGAIGDDYGGDSATGAVYVMMLVECPESFGLPSVYQSTSPTGARLSCAPTPLEGTGAHELDLYLVTGPDASTVGTLCAQDPAGGEGDELCAWDVRLVLDGGLTIQSFTPGSLAFETNKMGGVYPAQDLRVNWLDPGSPTDPTAGPIKLGDLTVTHDGTGGSIAVTSQSVGVGASAQLQPIVPQTIVLPEPGLFLGVLMGAALLAGLRRRHRSRCRLGRLLLCVVLLAPLAALTSSAARAGISVKGQRTFTQSISGGELYWSGDRIGDLDGNNVEDLAIGEESAFTNAVSIFFMEREGTDVFVEGAVRNIFENFGTEDFAHSVAALGDRDGDGASELAVGGPGYNNAGFGGQVTIVYLNDDGTEKSRHLIGDGTGGFAAGVIGVNDDFGCDLASLGDVDGDGIGDLAVGMPGQDGDKGSVWILLLDSNELVKDAFEITDVGPGNALDLPEAGDRFGCGLAAIGDLDEDGVPDLAVGAPRDDGGGNMDRGAIYILFLDWNAQTHTASVASHTKLAEGLSGMPDGGYDLLGSRALTWLGDVTGDGGGVLTSRTTPALNYHPHQLLYIGADGFYRSGYRMDASTGADPYDFNIGYGQTAIALPDWNGDETPDLFIGYFAFGLEQGYAYYIQDTDHDGLDDNLDNCPLVHNPTQDDGDDDGVGDLCDNCPALFNDTQDDFDTDGEGDVCEPVEVTLEFQSTASTSAPAWDLSLQCGTFDVTEVHGAIVMPAGSSNPKTLTLSGTSIGVGSGSSGPGLVSPAGVRDDAIYFSAFGNGAPDDRLCTALDPPILLGVLTTGAIGGTQLAAAALSEEGVGTPGFGLSLAVEDGAPIPETAVRLINGPPGPILDLELGPAVETASGTKWEVRVVRANDEFHRTAFGLIAPAGTTTANMRWLGCGTTPDGNGARDCCESPPCGDLDGLGVGTNVNPNRSFTVGPQSSPPGTQVPDTLYVVLEGSALSNGALDTVNPAAEGQYHVLGEIELSSSPDLEPALTVDGANDLDDLFSAGKVVPLVDVSSTTRLLDEVKLIGAFDPAEDLDGDGIQDLGDNCPFAPNPAQSNRGAFLDATDDSDPLGDACQCAEATDDGAVLDPDDFDEIRDYLSGRITNPVIAAEIEARCSVVGNTECNIRDLVFLQQAIAAGDPSVDVRCDAALSPPPAP